MLSTNKLAELVSRKRDVLLQLANVGQHQRRIVDEGDTTTLLQLLAAKQKLIVALQELEREMSPYQAEDPDARVWLSATDRARCAEQAAECNQLLEQVVALEKHSADRMIARRNEAAAQLRHVYTAGQARDAYVANRR
jgi:hypothetical protein